MRYFGCLDVHDKGWHWGFKAGFITHIDKMSNKSGETNNLIELHILQYIFRFVLKLVVIRLVFLSLVSV